MTRVRAGLVFAILALLAGCGGRQSTLAPESRPARDIAGLWWTLFTISAVVFALVAILVLLGVARGVGRRRLPPPLTAIGDTTLGKTLVLGGGFAIPAAVLATLFTYTMRTLPSTSPPTGAGDTELTVDVVGRQWFWDVSYPGQDVRTANEIHIPVGVRVAVKVSTKDVLHSFWVPRLNRKMDMIPGQENTLLLEADAPGTYRGQCAEYCGLQHAHMAFLVVAEPPADFDAWLAAQSRPASAPTSESERRGRDVFLSSACADCHTVSGTGADARVGPDLTHFASRRTIGAGTIPNRKGYLGGWILDPQHLKPGNKMPGITFSGSDFQALLDYVESLR